jgi:molecular chaperone HscB
MPADFLMQQMEWREALADASSPDTLLQLSQTLDSEQRALLAALEDEIARDDLVVAAMTIRKLAFLARFATQLDEVQL